MNETLRWRASEQPEQLAYSFLEDEGRATSWTYADLDRRARAIAARLQETGAPGRPVVLVFAPGLDYIGAFFGCLYAGAIAVPVYPPRAQRSGQLEAVLEDARPAAVLTHSPLVSRVAGRLRESGSPVCLNTDDLPAGIEEAWRAPEIGADSLALLQYTSGSTARPKGVMVSHGNLAANQRAIQEAFRQSERSSVVSWLPLYHDMGLIGGVIQPLWSGSPCHVMSPLAFLQKPARWLRAISRLRATTSGAPNFAYDLCVRRIGEEERRELDLSSWEVAFNGAEPVRAETLDRFAEAFAPCGFRREAFHPCYGLAEATLLVSAGSLGSRADGPVACGPAASGHRVAIADPATGAPVADGEVGEIWVAGPSVAQGYWNRPEETAETFGASLAGGEGPFLRTGDLGFARDGAVFVSGRLKDLIILRGRNHYPQDIEATAERAHAALRQGGTAAFPADLDGEERLVVVQELERNTAADPGQIAAAIRGAVAEEHEVEIFEVALVRAGAVPKTTSGKVRRRACREMLLAGELDVVFQSRSRGAGARSEAAERLRELREAGPGDRAAAARAYVAAVTAAVLRADPGSIDPAQPLSALGMDSLTSVELRNRLEADLGLELPLRPLLEGAAPEWIEAEVLRRLAAPAAPALPVAEIAGDFPLSQGQLALWYLHRLAPGSGAYNLAAALRIHGELDAGRLRRALRALQERHPSLRTVFPVSPATGEPAQRVLPDASLELEELPGGADLRERLRMEAERPFDLQSGPVLRAALALTAPGESVLLLTAHHIAADFWSLTLMARELGELYAGVSALDSGLEKPRARYADHVMAERALLDSAEGERLWSYWRERLAGDPAPLDLPADRPRPPVETGRGGVLHRVAPGLPARLRAAGRPAGATLYMVALAAWEAQLHRLSGQTDFVVGSPSLGRGRADLAGVVGYFVNPLPMRADLAGDPTFAGHLERVRLATLEALEHSALPLPRIVERLRPDRDAGRPPLFQTLFVLQSAPSGQEHLAALALGHGGVPFDLGGLACETVELGTAWSPMDLVLMVAETGGGLAMSLRYGERFDPATAERLLSQLERLAGAAADDPESRVADLPLLGEAERRQLLVEWNRAPGAAEPACLHRAVEAAAERTPGAVALSDGGVDLTYAELLSRADRLAAHLAAMGVGPEVPVGVCAGRSAETVAGILAVLKAGGAYVPMDPAYPEERLTWILLETGAPVLLVDGETPEVLLRGGARAVRLGEEPRLAAPLRQPAPENLACILYTSGSTGRPKGVGIRHAAASALLRWTPEVFSPADLAATLFSTSICFDLSLFEMFAPLAAGGRIVLAKSVLDLTAAAPVTLLNTVPSAAAELLERGALPRSLRVVNLAGEPLPRALADGLHAELPGVRVYNLYGPSEDTTYSTWAEIAPPANTAESRPPIGRSVAGSQAYVLDLRGEPAPVGVSGELFLGGDGLARGYHGRPDLTAERFLPDPFGPVPGARLYRTGDLARRGAGGDLEFLGRIDHQVKVRGFRIELGEVEEALRAHPGLRDAVVVAAGDGSERRLVAYVVAADEPGPAARDLREHLGRRLPEFMVPAVFATLPALPLTPNGKVDRRALPPLSAVDAARPELPFTPPRTPLEETLAATWAEVLGVESIGIHDHFFELGGHSLLAARVLERLRVRTGVELPLATLLERPTVGELAEAVEHGLLKALVADESIVPAAPGEAEGLLSFAQERLWFLEQLGALGPAYTLAAGYEIAGPLDEEALERALAGIVRRHDPLRSSFPARQGSPARAVADDPAPSLLRIDLSSLPEAERAPRARRLAQRLAERSFDVENGPLLRVALLRLDGERRLLLVAVHHLVSDGGSIGIFLRELSALYGAFRDGRPSPLPELRLGYGDFAAWQRRRLAGERLERLLGSWRERLAGLPAGVDLPVDRPYPPAQTFRGAALPVRFPREKSAGLRRLARGRAATPFLVLLAGFQALLHRYGGQTDVAVGVPSSGRLRAEWEPLIGLFVNVLPVRAHLSGDPAFAGLLDRVRRSALAAMADEELPFERMVPLAEEAGGRRGLARNPLFQVLLTLQPESAADLRLDGLSVEPLEVHTGTAKLELSLSLEETRGGISGYLEYNSDLFDEATAARLLGHLDTLLAGAALRPEERLSALPVMPEAELEQVLHGWNPEPESAPLPSFLERFDAAAARRPGAPALERGDETWTYAELQERADRLAAHLRAIGVGPDAVVGLCAEGSPELPLGMLAVLKAGGAFLPLDPAYPRERLGFMLEDSGARLVLALERQLPALPVGERGAIVLDRLDWGALPPASLPAGEPDPESLAYVIYTSGSTGRPKGVMVPRRGLDNLAAIQARLFGPGDGGRVLQLSSPSFDASVWEVVLALGSGAALRLASRRELLPGPDLAGLIRSRRVSHALIPPSALAVMPEEPLPSLELLFAGGEACPPALAGRWREGRRFVNLYGPTEGTVCATSDEPSGGRLTLGRPLPGFDVHLLGPGLVPLPVGAPGEICLGGPGLARGYVGRPERTAQAFVPHPFAKQRGARLYRTGDLGRRLADGRIEFLGRIDHQVKIRGFRVEPGEVEAALAAHPGVAGCAVVARSDGFGGGRLVAYAVPAAPGLAAEHLAAFLRERLPAYLVPSAFVLLDDLPRTVAGKVDRAALPEPSAEARPDEAPATPTETRIAALWVELLGVESPGVHEDFFAAGGHSLLAVRLAARLREAFAVELPVAAVFEHPTIAALAGAVDRVRGREAAADLRPVGRDGELPLSFGQERLWFLQGLAPASAAYNVYSLTRLSGPLDPGALVRALRRVTARHEVLRTVFPLGAAARPVQRVTSWPGPGLPVVDLASLPAGLAGEAALRLAQEESARPFDLERGPLFRALLLRFGEREHALQLALHHIVSDGGSMDLLAREIAAGYEDGGLDPLPLQYADFAAWQRAALTGEALAPQVAWWRERLAGAPGSLDLHTDRPRPAVQTDRGTAVPFAAPVALGRVLAEGSRAEGVTPFMALLAALAAVLQRYTGQYDLVIGSPAANRSRSDLEGLIGLFVNTLPLRCDLAGDPIWRGLLGRARTAALGAYANQEVPFEWLVEDLRLQRDLSRGPLFQVLLTFQEGSAGAMSLPGVQSSAVPLHNGTAKLDLTVSLALADGALTGGIELNSDLFDATTVARLAGHLGRLLAGALAEPERRLSELPLLADAERHQLVADWNDSAAEPWDEACIHEAIAARAADAPEAAAVVFRDRRLTRGELDRLAAGIAHRLRALGVGPGDRVGVSLERSSEMVAALLGVLKAGAAYLPLDPSYPEARLAAMVEDAGVAAVLTRTVLEDGFAAPAGPLPPGAAGAPAYLIYTSGSTGRPKGVVVTHRNVLSFFAAMDDLLAEQGPGVWLAVTSISFDISVLELLWTLSRGFTVVLQEDLRVAASPAEARPSRPVSFSLFYFADAGEDQDRYRLLLDGARFADEHGFEAVWTPERHFHPFGGLYPSPSVTGAAVAAVTRRVGVRAGSVVLPLHDPLRVAEEWSVVDNLSRGRVGISFASGWHADDFVLAPDHYAARKEVMLSGIETVRRLWRGEAVRRRGGAGNEVEVRIYPRPVQPELPVWLTAAGNEETFRAAGRIGANLLTHLLGQSVEDLAGKIAAYRAARREAGLDPEAGTVTLMLHTYVGQDDEAVREKVRGPLTGYLRSSAGLVDNLARSLGLGADAHALSEADMAAVLEHAFDRYFTGNALLGSRATCRRMLGRLADAGVDEIGCLIDFGVDADSVLASLPELAALRDDLLRPAEEDFSLPAQVVRHGATHLQCTPSLASVLAADPASREALRPLRKLLVGGEALPEPLAEDLGGAVGGEVLNMYGPTETTVWSLSERVNGGGVTIGRPLRNTGAYVLDPHLLPAPLGVPGEVYLAGDGVAAGYWQRPDLTAERFLPDPFGSRPGARLYRTGDLARHLPDGRLRFLGRADHQVKIRGHRIEPGEIEAALRRVPGVGEAVVVAREDLPGDRRLVAYVVPEPGRSAEPSRLEPKGELPPDRPRFRLPNGMVVTYLSDFQARTGYGEVFEDELYLRHGIELPDEACVFDVGANIGFFSLWLHGRCRDPRVFAFEPIPPTFETLRANLSLYGLDVRLFNQGMADRPGRADFGFYPNAPGLSGRFAGTDEDRDENRAIVLDWLRKVADPGKESAFSPEELEGVLDEQLRFETFSCELVTLSDVMREHGVERIDLLKVDVEKSELLVLQGIRDEDWPKIDQVVLEIHTRELLEQISALLASKGYALGTEDVAVVEAQAGEEGVHVHMLYAVSERLRRERGARGHDSVGTRPALSSGEMRRHLAARLPEPMVPERFVILGELPRTSNGKIDRRALPAPAAERPRVESVYMPPGTALEERIAAVWQETLGRERIGIHDNFFEVGGNSLLLVQVQTRLRQALGRDVAMVQMFRHPTVHALARALSGTRQDEAVFRLEEAEERARQQAGAVQQTDALLRQKQFLEERKRERSSRRTGAR